MVTGGCQGALEGADNQSANQGRVAETNFRLGRVNVDVDAVSRQLDKQMHFGGSRLEGGVSIRIMDGMSDRPVSHHATVHEHVLRPAGRPLIDQRGRIARDTHTGGLLLHFDQIGSLAVVRSSSSFSTS